MIEEAFESHHHRHLCCSISDSRSENRGEGVRRGGVSRLCVTRAQGCGRGVAVAARERGVREWLDS